MDKARRDTTLGLVFFLGLALLLWATQKLNSLSFTPKQEITAKFVDARGLRAGEPVFVLGTQNGKVLRVDISPTEGEYGILATFELDTPVELRESARIEIVDSSFLGGKKVNIFPGKTGRVMGEQHLFVGTAPLGPLDALGDMLGAEGNKENLQGTLEGLRQFVDRINESDGSLNRFITKSKLYDDFEALVAEVRKAAEDQRQMKSVLGRLLYDEAWGTRTDTIISNIDKAAAGLAGTESLLGRAINEESLGKRLDEIVDRFSQVATNLAGKDSLLGKAINDPEMGKKLEEVAGYLTDLGRKLNDKTSGLIGALINDEEMLADGRRIVRDFAEITTKVNNGDGALGRLINDPEMGRRLESMIRQVTRAIEDAREAAPIGTFFQVFGGAF